MAGRPTLWGAGEIVRGWFSRTAEPPPAYYLALIREIAPNPYVSGAELDEPSVDDGYARVVIPNDAVHWTETGQLQLTTNGEDITFLTATGDWGRCLYWALCNAEEEGYVYFIGEMVDPVEIYTGDQGVVGAGELVIELGPFHLDEEE